MRSYGQYCGLAKALDVVGDRWNLLVVRQLLLGPARYHELAEGLPGVATNLLTGRLRDLEEAGVIERRLSEVGNAVQYALTPWGAELRDPIAGLIRWSTPLMTQGPGDDHFQVDWLAVALPALLTTAPPGLTVGLTTSGQTLQVRTTPAGVTVTPPDGSPLDAELHADPAIILGLAAGALTLDAIRHLLTLHGAESALEALFTRD